MQVECETKAEDRHEHDITSVLYYSPYVYTSADDGKIKMWKEEDLSLVAEILAVEEPGYSIYSMSLSKKAGLLYSCGNDSYLRVWKLQNLQPASKQPYPDGSDRELWRVLCDDQTERVYTLNDQGIVLAYNMNTWQCVGQLLGLEQLRDIATAGDCVFTVRDLDVTCIEMTPTASGIYRSATRATLLGRAPLCIIPGSDPAVAFTTRDGRSIEVRSSDKKRRFEKLSEVNGASDKLINTICANQRECKIIYSAGWDSRISTWDIRGETGNPVCPPLQLSHVINVMTATSNAIYAGGPNGFLTKIRLT